MMNRPLLQQVEDLIHRPPRLYIGGAWVDSRSRDVLEVVDPSTGSTLGTSVESSTMDVDSAVRAARQAFDNGPWTQTFTPAPCLSGNTVCGGSPS